jgi:hypothetical protein
MKTLLFCATLLVTAAGTVSASGTGTINLGWNDCPSGGGVVTRTFACNTNAGVPNILFGTFVAGDGLTLVSGFAATIDLQTSGPDLAPWWQLRASLPAGCRSTSMGASFDFTGGPFNCTDYWGGGAAGGGSAEYPTTAANRARLKAQAALPLGDGRITAIPKGTEVYTFKLTINNQKTVGGACPGCSDEACIVLNSILVTQTPGTPGGNYTYSTPGTSSHCIWQAWTTSDPNHFCPQVTPAKSRTWGSIKAIYR